MYICSCFGITEQQVREHVDTGACTPRDIATRSGAGTDCGSCVRRIQGILGRGADCPRRTAAAPEREPRPAAVGVPEPAAVPSRPGEVIAEPPRPAPVRSVPTGPVPTGPVPALRPTVIGWEKAAKPAVW